MAKFTTILLYPDFGYCVLVVFSSWVMLNWLSLQVVRARKKYDVQYPAMYSETDPMFNCIQRAHQNTLESYPIFVVSLLLGGLQYPRICALGGLCWIISRIVYAKGYYSGNPDKRNRGAFGYVGLLVNLGCTVAFGLRLLGYI